MPIAIKIQLVGTLRFAHPAILNPKGGRGDRVLACVPNSILMTKPFASAQAVTAGSMPEQWHVDNGRLSCLSSMSPVGTFKTCRDVRHDAVNAILTPHELELMKAMVGRLDSGKEDRHAP